MEDTIDKVYKSRYGAISTTPDDEPPFGPAPMSPSLSGLPETYSAMGTP